MAFFHLSFFPMLFELCNNPGRQNILSPCFLEFQTRHYNSNNKSDSLQGKRQVYPSPPNPRGDFENVIFIVTTGAVLMANGKRLEIMFVKHSATDRMAHTTD